jgi:glucokinase
LIGLYLTGGLTPKNINWIKDPNGPFMSAFYDKVSLGFFLSEALS